MRLPKIVKDLKGQEGQKAVLTLKIKRQKNKKLQRRSLQESFDPWKAIMFAYLLGFSDILWMPLDNISAPEPVGLWYISKQIKKM